MSDRTHAWSCDRCFDIGFTYETVDGTDRVSLCQCRRAFEVASPGDRLQACRIPPLYLSRTLGNFEPRTPALREAYEQTLSYCEQFPHGGRDTGLGLLYWGRKGSGKTHLAAAALMELVVNKNVSGLLWDFRALYNEICRSYDKSTLTTDLTPFQAALQVDVLLLDDLASRTMPDWAHNTLFEIIDSRYRQRKPTFITTAFTDADAETAFTADPMQRHEFLVEQIGQRVRSRLLEMCLFIPMQAPEQRAAKPSPRRPTTLSGLRRAQRDKDRA